jgi:hypothetical protein
LRRERIVGMCQCWIIRGGNMYVIFYVIARRKFQCQMRLEAAY